MRWALALVLVAAGQVPAAAQPSTVVPLSEEERAILASGLITPGERFGGAALGLVVGFGTGQGVQGRLTSRGWMFTLADMAMIGTAVVAFEYCGAQDPDTGQQRRDPSWCNVQLAAILGFGVSHVWQFADALLVPPIHNRRLHEVRAKQNSRLRYQPTPPGWRSFVLPSSDGAGAVAGAAVNF